MARIQADPGPGDDTPAFPRDDPLPPGACELHLPADDVAIWDTARGRAPVARGPGAQ